MSDAEMTAAADTPGASDETSDEASDGDVAIANRAIIAHGTIMAFTFVLVFPTGALLIRFASVKGLVWVHAAVQGFGYILAFTGLGLGVYIAIVPTFQVCSHPLVTFWGETRGHANGSTAKPVSSYHWHHCYVTPRLSTPDRPTTSSCVRDLC